MIHPRTEESQAIAIATKHAARQKLAWNPPIEAESFLEGGRMCWLVKTNANGRGFSVEIVIDDKSHTILETRVLPR